MADTVPEEIVEEDDLLTEDELREKYAPTYIGPCWTRTDEGSWLLPERTLGWEIGGWCAQWLRASDGGPWKFTPEQFRLILWWYAIDEAGEFIYRNGVVQRLKGWGKDPMLAVICLVEMCGPSRFSHFDPKTGQPVGKTHNDAWVQVAAVSRDQTQNTMSVFPSLMSEEFKKAYNIIPGVELIRGRGGRVKIEAVTSSPRSLEGKRSTFVVMNETHHWIESNQGHKMHETIDNNTVKVNSRYLAITNAYMPGEESVAEKMRREYDMFREGRALDTSMMYDSVEGHPQTPLKPRVLEAVLPLIRGDSVWLPIPLIVKSMMSVSIDLARSKRMWLNQVVADTDALYDEAMLKAIEDLDDELQADDEITLGFDGGKTDDATALIAFRLRDNKAFLINVWEKPDGAAGENWHINTAQVDSAVREAFQLYDVQAFYADVALWESYIAEWEKDYAEGLVVRAEGRWQIGWDMRKSQKIVTYAHERLAAAIFDERIKYDGNLIFRRHMLNARRRVNDYGVSFGKESRESPKKVDAYAALLLAYEAAYDVRTRGKKTKKKTGRSYWF